MYKLVAAGMAALLALDLAEGADTVLAPGHILPVRFFCVTPEPLLDMLALDAAGDPGAAGERFEAARQAGACHALASPVPGTTIAFMAAGVTTSAGRIEVWAVAIAGVPDSVFAGFRVGETDPAGLGDPA